MIVMMLMIPQRQCFDKGVQAEPYHHTPRKSARTAVIMVIVMGVGVRVTVFHTQRYGVQRNLNEESDQDQGTQKKV